MAGTDTVMIHVAVRLVPSVLMADIVVVPTATAVIKPDVLTVAIAILLEDHNSVLLVAFDGTIAADNCVVAPGTNVIELGINDNPVIKMGFADTTTETELYTFDPSVP